MHAVTCQNVPYRCGGAPIGAWGAHSQHFVSRLSDCAEKKHQQLECGAMQIVRLANVLP